MNDSEGDTTTGSPHCDNSKKAVCRQDVKACKIALEKKRDFVLQLEDLLRKVRQKPDIYNNTHLRPLREFCEYRYSHRDKFTGVIEGTMPLQPNHGGNVLVELTPCYIKAIAEYDDTSNLRNPVLQVVSATTSFKATPFKNTYDKPQQPVKVTHLRLMDGCNNTMLGRLAINITDEGKKLKEGDIIRLEMYTELTHTLNIKDGEPKPVVYVIKFSLVGYNALPMATYINDPMECDRESLEKKLNCKSIHLNIADDFECNGSCCSLYGIRMVLCVCRTNCIAKMNLQTPKDECWLANKEVDKMSNSEKRCMLYWWFATTICAICGARKRALLPECVVAAGRKQYPEPDGNYKGYKARRYIGRDPEEV